MSSLDSFETPVGRCFSIGDVCLVHNAALELQPNPYFVDDAQKLLQSPQLKRMAASRSKATSNFAFDVGVLLKHLIELQGKAQPILAACRVHLEINPPAPTAAPAAEAVA